MLKQHADRWNSIANQLYLSFTYCCEFSIVVHIKYKAEIQSYYSILGYILLIIFPVGNTAEIIHKMPMPWLTY